MKKYIKRGKEKAQTHAQIYIYIYITLESQRNDD